MSISIASRKSKGRNLQQWICARLSELTGIPWGPDDDALISSRPMSQSGVDIILRGEAADRVPFSFECKNGESFKLVASIEQARANEKPGRPWLIVHRRKKFRNPIVMMDWDTFAVMLKIQQLGHDVMKKPKESGQQFLSDMGVSDE